MRQMLPAVKRSREGRMTARPTVQGKVLGAKDSEKGARRVPFSERKESPDERAPHDAHGKGSLGSLLCGLLSQKPQTETLALQGLIPQELPGLGAQEPKKQEPLRLPWEGPG